MTPEKSPPKKALPSSSDQSETGDSSLCGEAEARLTAKQAASQPEEQVDTQRLVHELQVHQIELEMQNDELGKIREKLERSRARYFNLFDLAPVGILTLDEEGLIHEANLKAASQLGLTRELLVNRKLEGFIFKEDRGLYYLHQQQLFENGFSQPCEIRMQCADQSMLWVRVEGNLAQAENGTQLCQAILSNITRAKQAEQTLLSSARDLQQLFDEMSSGFALHEIICDKRGKPVDYRFLEMNAAFENLTGLVAEKVVGKRVLEVLPETEPLWIETYGRVALTGQPESFENFSQTLGKTFSVVAYCPQQGQFAVLFEDITERTLAEQGLLRRNEDLDLLNAVNNAIINGESLETVFDLISEKAKVIFNSFGSTINLVNSDRTRLVMQNLVIPAWLLKSIEKLTGIHIPGIEHDLQSAHPYLQVLNTGRSQLINDPEGIQEFMKGYIACLNVQQKTRIRLENMMPAISKLVDRRSVMVIPLISNNVIIGTLDIGSSDLFTEEDLLRLEAIAASLTTVILRKQAEEELREERQRMAGILQGTNAGTWEWNVQTGETVFNDRWAEMIGYTLDEISPISIDTWMKYAHPDDLKASAELLEKHFSGEIDYYEFETRMKHKDGNWIWIVDRGKVISWTDDGKPLVMMGTHQDITKSKYAEEAVKTERNFALQIMNSMGQGLTVTDEQGRFEYVNPAYAHMTGYDPKALLGKTPEDINALESLTILEKEAARRRLGETSSYEVELKHSDGHLVPVMISGVPRRETGEIIGTIAVITDLTERKEAEETLQKIEHDLLDAQKLANIGTWTYDPLLQQPQWSEEMFRIWGLDSKLGAPAYSEHVKWIHPEDYQRFDDAVQAAVEHGTPYELELRICRPDGDTRTIITICEPQVDSNGKITSLKGTTQDITKRNQAEENLQESERRYRERATELETIMDIAPVALWIAQDPSCHVIVGNRTANELHRIQSGLNASMTPVEGQQSQPDRLKIFHDGVEITAQELPLQICASKGIDISDFESKIVFEDGKVVHEIGNARPLFDENGQPRGAIGAFMDITERKQAEEEIQRRAEELDALQKTVFDITASQSLPGLLESIVERACQLVGAPGGGLYLTDPLKKEVRCDVSYNTGDKFVGVVLKYGEGVAGKVAQTGQPFYIENYQAWSGRALSSDLERPFTAILGVPLLWGGQVSGVIDVLHFEEGRSFNKADEELLELFAGHAAIAIENSRLLETSQAGEAQVRELSTRLAEAEENERRRIARELHDQVGQSLSALSINMNIMSSQVPQYLPGFKRRLDDSLMLIDQTTDHIRHLMSELRPAVLDDYGLKAALDWAVGSIANRTNLKLLVEGECKRFPPRIEIALFRIAQEALGNISNHAHARNVVILLTQDGPDMSMSITDDGIGFDPSNVAATDKSGWGLRLMAERAESIGATLQVESTPGKGTCITARYHDNNTTGG